VSDYFTNMMAEAKRIAYNLSTVLYSILISGLNLKVLKYEGEIDYRADVMQYFVKFRHRSVKDYRDKFSDRVGTDHAEGQILESVARLYPEIFSKLDNLCTILADFTDPVVRRFDREIQSYLAYLDYIRKIKATGLAILLSQDHAPQNHICPRGLRSRSGGQTAGREITDRLQRFWFGRRRTHPRRLGPEPRR
jgi:DNA mismatch repair protein MutS